MQRGQSRSHRGSRLTHRFQVALFTGIEVTALAFFGLLNSRAEPIDAAQHQVGMLDQCVDLRTTLCAAPADVAHRGQRHDDHDEARTQFEHERSDFDRLPIAVAWQGFIVRGWVRRHRSPRFDSSAEASGVPTIDRMYSPASVIARMPLLRDTAAFAPIHFRLWLSHKRTTVGAALAQTASLARRR
jgi:hypothetical protein